MGCIQSYFKRAHNAGLSPSSTQDSNSKTAAEDGSCTQAANSTGTVEKDKVSADFTSGDKQPEEPESNDTSYGVEATAVRTLAASTGTVAILGTTAKTPQSRRESRVSNIDKSDNEESNSRLASTEGDDKSKEVNADSINVEIKDEHKNASTKLVNDIELDKVASNTVDKVQPVLNSSSTGSSDKVVAVEPPTKEEEVDENSTKQTTTALVEDVKVDDSTSVGGVASPFEDGGFSENNFTSEHEDDDDRPTTVLEIEKASSNTEMRTSISENSENDDTKGIDDEISSEQLKTNSLSDTTLSESYNAGLDSVKQSDGESATPVVENLEGKEISIENGVTADDLKNGDLNSVAELGKKVVEEVSAVKKEVVEIESKNTEADSKKEVEEEPIVKTVANKVESAPVNCNSGVDQTYSNDAEQKAFEGLEKVAINEVINKVENGLTENSVLVNRAEINGVRESVSIKELDKNGEIDDDKMSAAATTIQATFRGYQTRQQNAKDKANEDVKSDEIPEVNNLLQETASDNVVEVKVMQIAELVDEETEKKLESIIASKEGLIEAEEKMDAAATAIQATFRGYQTRQNIKKDDSETKTKHLKDSKEEDSTETKKSDEASQKDNTKKVDEVIHKEKDSVATTKIDDKKASIDTTKSNEDSYKEKDAVVTTKANEAEKENDSVDKTVADNASQSVNAQVDKVPGSVEQTKSDSPKNIQVDKVKVSQESSDTSSFDSVQNGSTNVDPVTCVSIKDKSKIERVEGEKIDKLSSLDKVETVVEKVENVIEKEVDKQLSKVASLESKENSSISIEESKQKLLEGEKESLAATTIQANFRGYQARQNLQKKDVSEQSGEKEGVITNGADDKVESAAIKIQSCFRGYQTRMMLKEEEDDAVVVEALSSRTPELVESVREEVDEICKQAVETTENIISQGLHKFHKSASVEEEGEGRQNGGLVDKSEVVDVAKQTIEAVLEKAEQIADEKLNSAATTIQASFRGFQARQNLEKNTDPDVGFDEKEEKEEGEEEDIDKMIDQMFGNLKTVKFDF